MNTRLLSPWLWVVCLVALSCDDVARPECTDTDATCDGVDDDCDGSIDEDATWVRYWVDDDGDGFGGGEPIESCATRTDLVDNGVDCDDADAQIHPGVDEVCDGVDNDCDGAVDDEDPSVVGTSAWYIDSDGDGFGGGPAFLFCSEPAGDYVLVAGDCDDLDDDVNPDAQERCDGLDNDCDGLVDDEDDDVGDSVSWYRDADGDGFGDSASAVIACAAPDGRVIQGGDCDDDDDQVNPDAEEICRDGVDSDCDGDAGDCQPLDGQSERADASTSVLGATSYFGNWVAAADLDGDAQDELLISDRSGGDEGYGAVYAFSGLEPGQTLGVSDALGQVEGNSTDGSLGYNMAAPGDLDGDGYDDVVIFDSDATLHVFDGPLRGSVAVADAYAQLTGVTLVSSYTSMCTLVAGGRLDTDRVDDLVVGDPYSSNGGGYSGTAWVLRGALAATTGSSLDDLAVARIDGSSGAHLGYSVSMGDTDGDGMGEVMLSARYDSTYSSSAGAVYLLQAPMGSLETADADTIIYGSYSGGQLGLAATIDGDLDGDGYDDLAVSAPNDDTFGNDSGVVYLFYGPINSSPTVSYNADALTYGTGHEDYGYSVDIVAGFDDDGKDDLFIGDLGSAESGYSDAGAMHLYYGKVTGSRKTPDAMVMGDASYQYYGLGLRGVGDLDADGYTDVAVSGYGFSDVDLFFGGDGL